MNLSYMGIKMNSVYQNEFCLTKLNNNYYGIYSHLLLSLYVKRK